MEEPDEKVILMRQVLKTIKPTFSEAHWEIINLLVFAEKNSFETAEILGMTPAAVRSRIMKRIQEEYDSLGVEDDLSEKSG